MRENHTNLVGIFGQSPELTQFRPAFIHSLEEAKSVNSILATNALSSETDFLQKVTVTLRNRM